MKPYIAVKFSDHSFNVSYSDKRSKVSSLQTMRQLNGILQHVLANGDETKVHEIWLTAQRVRFQYTSSLSFLHKLFNKVLHLFNRTTTQDKINKIYKTIIKQDKVQKDALEIVQSLGLSANDPKQAARYLDLLYSSIITLGQNKVVQKREWPFLEQFFENKDGVLDPEEVLLKIKKDIDENRGLEIIIRLPYLLRAFYLGHLSYNDLYHTPKSWNISEKKLSDLHPFFSFFVAYTIPKLVEDPKHYGCATRAYFAIDNCDGNFTNLIVGLIRAKQAKFMAYFFFYLSYSPEAFLDLFKSENADAIAGEMKDLYDFWNKYYYKDEIDQDAWREWWKSHRDKVISVEEILSEMQVI